MENTEKEIKQKEEELQKINDGEQVQEETTEETIPEISEQEHVEKPLERLARIINNLIEAHQELEKRVEKIEAFAYRLQ